MAETEAPLDAGPRSAALPGSDLILDFDLGNPKHLRWAATHYDRLAVDLRAAGDVPGPVAAQVRADRYRLDSSTMLRPQGSPASTPSHGFAAWTTEADETDQNYALAEGPAQDVEDVGLGDD